MSATGKNVPIKSVAQVIPVYSMSRFKFTRGRCEHLTSTVRAFWWEASKGRGNLIGWHGIG